MTAADDVRSIGEYAAAPAGIAGLLAASRYNKSVGWASGAPAYSKHIRDVGGVLLTFGQSVLANYVVAPAVGLIVATAPIAVIYAVSQITGTPAPVVASNFKKKFIDIFGYWPGQARVETTNEAEPPKHAFKHPMHANLPYPEAKR